MGQRFNRLSALTSDSLIWRTESTFKASWLRRISNCSNVNTFEDNYKNVTYFLGEQVCCSLSAWVKPITLLDQTHPDVNVCSEYFTPLSEHPGIVCELDMYVIGMYQGRICHYMHYDIPAVTIFRQYYPDTPRWALRNSHSGHNQGLHLHSSPCVVRHNLISLPITYLQSTLSLAIGNVTLRVGQQLSCWRTNNI